MDSTVRQALEDALKSCRERVVSQVERVLWSRVPKSTGWNETYQFAQRIVDTCPNPLDADQLLATVEQMLTERRAGETKQT